MKNFPVPALVRAHLAVVFTVLALSGPCQARGRAATGITKIVFTEGGSMRGDTGYTMTINADGSATLRGGAASDRSGIWRASLGKKQFRALAQDVTNSGFYACSPGYGGGVTDQLTLYFLVTRRGKVKSVTDYGSNGPQGLVKLETEMENLEERIAWQPVRVQGRD